MCFFYIYTRLLNWTGIRGPAPTCLVAEPPPLGPWTILSRKIRTKSKFGHPPNRFCRDHRARGGTHDTPVWLSHQRNWPSLGSPGNCRFGAFSILATSPVSESDVDLRKKKERKELLLSFQRAQHAPTTSPNYNQAIVSDPYGSEFFVPELLFSSPIYIVVPPTKKSCFRWMSLTQPQFFRSTSVVFTDISL
jgi:hypothetical protein